MLTAERLRSKRAERVLALLAGGFEFAAALDTVNRELPLPGRYCRPRLGADLDRRPTVADLAELATTDPEFVQPVSALSPGGN